ncbi:Hypothetical protein NTJ_14431 [Nesidiocoris tenuis]|uniref:RZZ complex subunit KNTC1/ROD C-terminal domain-containing protein n=1 Tax=Nesidiocoris tenuis TaxID=355587 RepID=A0ABN7BD52_9HEMI|nr:Hypothetical protein NTJ_14431 [Nesidiocoris tenuis]
MGDGVRADIVAQLLALSSEKQVKLADAFKSFNLYVGSRNDAIAADIVNILENFQPRNNLGQVLRWRLVDRYRVTSEVARALRGGDNSEICRALKCDWFFEDLSDPGNFATQEIPSYSLSTRLKVVNKYGLFLKDGRIGDKLYAGVKARYGMRTALPLLPACTDKFIVDQLSALKIDLHPRVVQALYDRHRSLITEYLVDLASSDDSARKSRLSQFNPVMGKLAVKNLENFLDLFDKSGNSVDVTLGRRPTKKIIKFDVDRITGDFDRYKRLFRDKIFYSRLSLEQFKRLYAALLPEKMSEFHRCSCYSRALTSLASVQPHLRSNVVVDAFNVKYGRQLTDESVLHNVESTWVPYLPEEAKISWVERKLSSKEGSPDDQASYMAVLPTKLSIPKLKKLIESQSNAANRTKIVIYFLQTIKLNQDPSQMADVFAYFVRRFRNEVAKFREAIVWELGRLDVKLLAALDLKDWGPINDYINVMKLNNEVSSYKYILRDMFSVQVNTFREKGEDVDACIRNYLEYERSDGFDLDADVARLCVGTPSYKYCLEWFLREEPSFKWRDNDNRLLFVVQLFSNVADYNKDRTDGRIDLPVWMVDILNGIIEDPKTKSYTMSSIAKAILRSPDSRLKSIPTVTHITSELACSWLKKDPSSVPAKIPLVMEKSLNSGFRSWRGFFRKCRLYDAYGIPSMIVKLCRVTLKLEDPEYDLDEDSAFLSASSQPAALQILAVFVEPSEYMAIVKPYTPTVHKIEDYSDELKALYNVQRVVCNPFLDFAKPADCLPIVREFAKGDYLKSAVPILVGLCCKIPEKQILPIVTGWIDCPVSLRKHLLRMIYKIAPLQDGIDMFTNVFATEKNTSLRLVLFQMLRKIFVNEPVEENFDIFLPIVGKLTVEDEEALQKLFEISDIDDAFVSRYVARLWYLVGTEWAQVLPNGKEKISQMAVNRSLSLLDESLCDELLSYNLSASFPKSAPTGFLNAYLADSKSASLQVARLDNVLKWLKPLIAEQWHRQTYDSGFPVCPVRHAVSQMALQLAAYCSRDVNFDVSPTWLLNELKTSLLSIVKTEYFLAEAIALDEAVVRRKWIQLGFDDAAHDSAVADMILDYVAKHGDTYGQILVRLLSDLQCGKSFHRISAQLVEKSSDRLVQLVAIGGLGDEPDDDQLPFYKKAIGELSKSGDPLVQAELHNLLKNLRYVSNA